MATTQKNNSTAALHDPLKILVEREGEIQVYDVLNQFQYRTYGFVIFLLALIVVIPTGIIPGVAIATSLVICVVVAQYVFGKDYLYIPQFIGTRVVARSLLVSMVSFLEKHDTALARIMGRERYEYLFHTPFQIVTSVGMVCVALSTFPLTLTVFIESVPGAIMMLYGLALISKNGRLLIAAWIITGIYFISVLYFIQYITSLF